MSPQPEDALEMTELTSQAYQITVDGGRDTFCALSIESPDKEDAWLISDTVRSLENMR